MKIALVGSSDVSEGTEGQRTSALASALARRGHDVALYGLGREASSAQDYRVVRTAPPKSCGSVLDDEVMPAISGLADFLAGAWADDRPDVVNAQDWAHGLAAQLACKRHGLPVVQSLPTLFSSKQRRQRRAVGSPGRMQIELLVAKNAAGVTVPCTEDAQDLIRLGCARSRISVLPRGIDVESYGPYEVRRSREGVRCVVAVARSLAPHKGLDTAIQAVAKLQDTELVIVGGPRRAGLARDEDARRLRTLADSLGLGRRVRFTGHVPSEDVPQFIRSADALVCPSWYEPSGQVVLEAMACGVPVVASAAGGMLDAVVHDVTGKLVPPGNPTQLALALRELLGQGVLREAMGMSGHDRVRARYCWERVAADVEATLERATAGSLVAGRR